MQQVKTILSITLATLLMLAGLGVGIIIAGFALVLGGALALALQLGVIDKKRVSAHNESEVSASDLIDEADNAAIA